MACEVISRVERRRHWPTAEKLRIMSEALEPGATVAAVADRNGVCRSQIYSWDGPVLPLVTTDNYTPCSKVTDDALSRRADKRSIRLGD
jgi:Transposase